MRRDVFRKFLTLPTSFIEKHSTGPLLSKMTYNVEMVAESVTTVVTMPGTGFSYAVLAALSVMLYQSVRLTLFLAVVLPVIAVHDSCSW